MTEEGLGKLPSEIVEGKPSFMDIEQFKLIHPEIWKEMYKKYEDKCSQNFDTEFNDRLSSINGEISVEEQNKWYEILKESYIERVVQVRVHNEYPEVPMPYEFILTKSGKKLIYPAEQVLSHWITTDLRIVKSELVPDEELKKMIERIVDFTEQDKKDMVSRASLKAFRNKIQDKVDSYEKGKLIFEESTKEFLDINFFRDILKILEQFKNDNNIELLKSSLGEVGTKSANLYMAIQKKYPQKGRSVEHIESDKTRRKKLLEQIENN